ncbi:indolepyruvate ferredoxin oxidoreductase family protein [Elioraea thermophila]|uniref:indolepyruvate ferredoxin oxidoreductase family protein n=1 Tax=Elioraea thermophila TaxID=2185104 RepID=UPI000DF4AFD5|nr:indolepyruvate ferredoxin oxidoreductase family protein [Elioraea thermophila]
MDSLSGTAPITLESRFIDLDSPVLLTGIQALVRVLLEQARLDRAAGLNTAGLVSGYRGSPLGGLDKELWARRALLDAAGVRFQPGINEDLAATLLWGAQMLEVFPGRRVEGVFGLWYGKGPGVDRSGDAFRHANAFGTHAKGGVLAVAGDDHAAQSSVLPHQSDQIFEAAMIPLLHPASVQDILDLGLAGIAMSRFSGLWVGLKTVAETVEAAATVVVPSARRFVRPEIEAPPWGFNLDPRLRWPEQRAELERRVIAERLPAASAFARANALDRLVFGNADAPIGLVTCGKAHLDVVRALDLLGLGGGEAERRGIALYKVALTWPVEPEGLTRFASGKKLLIVVEEKRSLVKRQARDILYNLPTDRRPAIIGKRTLSGEPLLPEHGELDPVAIARALARVLPEFGVAVSFTEPDLPPPAAALIRAPYFCAGCPHNTSTVVPEGALALGGIGCHTLALGAVGRAKTVTHMGAEGVTWVGLAPFVEVPHAFVNMGDGTWQHSGILAIRQAVAAGANVTYKILYNSAVAMTGGQPVDGGPSVAQIVRQLAAEGVARIAVVADDAARLPPAADLPPGVERATREHLLAVQERFRTVPGVSAIVYDQVCATEKRRKRKRGTMPAPETSVLINERVCENCGDCTVQSNCVAIEPVETEFGRKRRVSPSTCNTDLSCLKGYCPSFVTVAAARKPKEPSPEIAALEERLGRELPTPLPPPLGDRPWRALFAGVGGGGIVTAGAITAMAAHLEGRAVRTLDFTGLAQKNGAVVGHVQIAAEEALLDVARVPLRGADLLIAADMAVAAGRDVLPRLKADGAVVGQARLASVAAFVRDADVVLDCEGHRRALEAASPAGLHLWLDAARLAEVLFGEAQTMNTLLLGAAWQKGLIPVRAASLLRAIELNGVAVATNKRAFLWGRALAHEPRLADRLLAERRAPETLDDLIANRAADLVRYQNERLAQRFRTLADHARAIEEASLGRAGAVTRAVADGYHRVLAYKDEYEVARHLSDPAFLAGLKAEFGDTPLTFHLSPPLPFLGRDPATGRRRKIALPARVALPVFRLLARLKALRGSWLDPFHWQEDRRLERAAIRLFEADVAFALAHLRPATAEACLRLLSWPFAARGFGPIKRANHAKAMAERAAARAALSAAATPVVAPEPASA